MVAHSALRLSTLVAVLAATAAGAQTTRVEVVKLAPVFVTPYERPEALAVAEVGVEFAVLGAEGDWYLVEYDSKRLGRRRGYIHRDNVKPMYAVAKAEPTPPMAPAAPATPPQAVALPKPTAAVASRFPKSSPARTLPSSTKSRQFDPPAQATVKLNGYIDWNKGEYLVVDGQRVRWTHSTRLRGGALADLPLAPLGLEARVVGVRADDGAVTAREIEFKANGLAMYEAYARQVGDMQERRSLSTGAYLSAVGGHAVAVGTVTSTGPEVERCKAVMTRLLPPAINGQSIRVYVVETDEWNAEVMPNGSVWVYSGLLRHLRSDDELAAVLGHELAHYTHEHMRKKMARGMWIDLVTLAAVAGTQEIADPSKRYLTEFALDKALTAWRTSYSRDYEEQADRVGLRYAFEAGFDVNAAPTVWRRVVEQEGDMDHFTAFFSTHPRHATRIDKLEVEIRNNYARH